MGDQRHRLVVLSGAATEPVGPHSLGQALNQRQRLRIGGGRGGRHPRAPAKQPLLPRLHARLSRTSHRMTGDKTGMQALPELQHRRLHRTHIGDHRLGRQRRQQLLRRLQQPV